MDMIESAFLKGAIKHPKQLNFAKSDQAYWLICLFFVALRYARARPSVCHKPVPYEGKWS